MSSHHTKARRALEAYRTVLDLEAQAQTEQERREARRAVRQARSLWRRSIHALTVYVSRERHTERE